ncbi:MAG: hypothetical protein JJU29_08110 [Verrucomicrobia bacterium]|nr:hypothetical protein [Verrucomicrobiota bacterium]MCH8511871.1 hypothetical protein [Kiritimatiellia bacterium]
MKSAPKLIILDTPFDAADGADTPFGKRYGGDVFALTDAHLSALRNGKTLALDVQNEYVAFLTSPDRAGREVGYGK